MNCSTRAREDQSHCLPLDGFMPVGESRHVRETRKVGAEEKRSDCPASTGVSNERAGGEDKRLEEGGEKFMTGKR